MLTDIGYPTSKTAGRPIGSYWPARGGVTVAKGELELVTTTDLLRRIDKAEDFVVIAGSFKGRNNLSS